ncbi:MAG: polysaccharide biosynthesis/export family protein [Bacteroidales bacterium]|nr:polysaccharide biosynthesis/export family protein [Bacteroidales bacterium]
MKRIIALTALAALLLLAASCSTQRKYAYLDDAPRNEEMAITNNYSSLLMPGDQLYIHVDSKSPQSTEPFNEETNRAKVRANVVTGQIKQEIHGYIVSEEGDIIFPILGRIHASDKTIEQLASYIEGRLVAGRYVRDPQVTVRLMNFRVTVIGEVVKPQQIHVEGTRLTIFEALAMCGDVTMDGLRDCVTIIRMHEDETTVDTIDLTSREVLNSPYYYLHQNDIVYVEPTPKKKRTAWRNEDWPQYISTGAQALRIAYLLYYRYTYDPTYRRYREGQ